MEETCEICGDKFDKLGTHVWTVHRLKKADYNNAIESGTIEQLKKEDPVVSIKEVDTLKDKHEKILKEKEEVQKDSVTLEERRRAVFKSDDEKIYYDLPLKDFLLDNSLSERELRSVVAQYKTGRPVDVTQQLKRNKEFGETQASQLKDNDTAETTNVNVAEELVSSYGFEVVSVKGSPKKTWFLRKL